MALEYRQEGPDPADALLILAHGAGQDMDAPFMSTIARLLAEKGIRVARFNFPYMTQRIASGRQRPPDREPRLLEHWRQVISEVSGDYTGRLFIGGKSMGGRMASLIADEMQVAGLICLGYPFHPPGKPDRLRTAHLAGLQTPSLICQGERDSFGRRGEVEQYALSPAIRLHWLADGDHSFKPRKSSGLTFADNLTAAARAVHSFIRELA